MSKQTEALKLALAAVYETIIQWDEGGGKRSRRELARRIVALAEHPAQRLVVAHAPCQGMNCGITSTDQEHSLECQAEHAAAIAGGQFVKPAQQEPVAWTFLNGQYAHIVWGKQRPDDEIHTIPLYTSPPASKPWVGLTDVEWQEIDASLNGKRDLARIFVRAIEAKLQEKNA